MTAKLKEGRRRSARRVIRLLSLVVLVALVTGCGGASIEGDAVVDPPAKPSNLHRVDGETAHLQCQGTGTPTLVFLGGMGFTTTTWASLRAALGSDVRTCAWDYPGVGHSTGE